MSAESSGPRPPQSEAYDQPAMPPGSLSRAALAAIAERLSPGASLRRLRRLRGGLGGSTTLLRLVETDGSARSLVLRVPRSRPGEDATLRVRREFRTLQLLAGAGIAAPRPVFLDAEGQVLGASALTVSYLAGRSGSLLPSGPGLMDGLARGITAVHAIGPRSRDLSHLEDRSQPWLRERLSRPLPEAVERDPLARRIAACLARAVESIAWPAPCLVHDDFWPGNTVFFHGRLAGVIDWADACLGDPRADVAQCRLDLALSHGLEAATAFEEAYQSRRREPLPDIWFFDLLRGIDALAYYERWLDGYRDMGLRGIDARLAGERLRALLGQSLARGNKA